MATSKDTEKKTNTKQVKETAPETESVVAVKETITPKKIDPDQYVIVRNGFQGQLVYKSKRTGELFVWEEFGAEQEMTLGELRNARNSSKKFFENNWFMFDEEWIVDYLGVGKFYKHAIKLEDFDGLFREDPKIIKEIISKMSDGQKRSLAYRAKKLIADGGIDSRKVVQVLETGLGIELIER